MRMVLPRPFHAGQHAGERAEPPALALGGALDVGRIGDHRHLERARCLAAGSLATTTRSMTCGRSRSTTCATIGRPPSGRSGFGTPGPMRRPSPPASTTPTRAPARTGLQRRPEMLHRLARHGGTMRRAEDKQGEERDGVQHRQGRQLAASGRPGARRRRLVARRSSRLEDERTAYKVQDAFLKKLVAEAGTAGRLQDRADLAADLGADRPARPGLRADPQEARVRAQGRRCAPTSWARLGVELEIILTINADVPRPKGKPYDKDLIARLCRRGARRLRADRGSRRRLQPADASIG